MDKDNALNSVVDQIDQPESKKMGFFDSVLEPPNWLTQNYVQEALKKFEGDPKLKVKIYRENSATTQLNDILYRSPSTP